MNEKDFLNQSLQQKSIEKNKYLGSPLCKILRIILKMDKGLKTTEIKSFRSTNCHSSSINYSNFISKTLETEYIKEEEEEKEEERGGGEGGG